MSEYKNSLVYREQLDDNVIEMLKEDIGDNYSLRTENQRTIVAALNEIHGKDVISNAVGSPLLTTDTFDVMGEKIVGLTNDFKVKLLGLGVSVSSVDKLESLISKLDRIDLGADAGEILSPFIETLSGILADEGVMLNGNETLGELIIKVDERFDELHAEINELEANVNSLETELAGKVVPAGNAVAGDVLSGKTFINSTGETITGTMTNRGGAQTVTPGTSNKTLNSGYYSGNITVKGDANLVASNIVSGKSIFGVSGTAKTIKGNAIPFSWSKDSTQMTSSWQYKRIQHSLGEMPSFILFLAHANATGYAYVDSINNYNASTAASVTETEPYNETFSYYITNITATSFDFYYKYDGSEYPTTTTSLKISDGVILA